MSKDATNQHSSSLKSRVREKVNKFKERVVIAKKNSETNSWTRTPRFGAKSLSNSIKNYLKFKSLQVLPTLIAKKNQEVEARDELACKLFDIDASSRSKSASHNQQSQGKASNGWLAVMNFFAWPYALLKLGMVSFNLLVETVDQVVSLSILKIIKRLTPSNFNKSQGNSYESEIQILIDDIKENGSLPARAIKYLVNFAEIIPAIILSWPIDAGREIDAWLDKQLKPAGGNAASNEDNTSAPAAVAEQVSEAPTNNTQAPASQPPAAAREKSENAAVADDSKEVMEKHSEEEHQATVQTTVESSRDVQQNNSVTLEQGQKQQVEQQQKRAEAAVTSTRGSESSGGTAYKVIALCHFGTFANSSNKPAETTEATTLHQRGPSFAA
jgi:hypothetical protein